MAPEGYDKYGTKDRSGGAQAPCVFVHTGRKWGLLSQSCVRNGCWRNICDVWVDWWQLCHDISYHVAPMPLSPSYIPYMNLHDICIIHDICLYFISTDCHPHTRYSIYIYIYSDGLKLRMPFWKCHFEVYARRFLNLECLPTPCFPNMIKSFNVPDILQVSGLFLLQSDRLTAWVNVSSWPKTLLPKAWKRKKCRKPCI